MFYCGTLQRLGQKYLIKSKFTSITISNSVNRISNLSKNFSTSGVQKMRYRFKFFTKYSGLGGNCSQVNFYLTDLYSLRIKKVDHNILVYN